MKEFNLTEVNEKISKESAFVDDLRKAFSRIIVGQKELINKIIISLLANGHILLEDEANNLVDGTWDSHGEGEGTTLRFEHNDLSHESIYTLSILPSLTDIYGEFLGCSIQVHFIPGKPVLYPDYVCHAIISLRYYILMATLLFLLDQG